MNENKKIRFNYPNIWLGVKNVKLNYQGSLSKYFIHIYLGRSNNITSDMAKRVHSGSFPERISQLGVTINYCIIQ